MEERSSLGSRLGFILVSAGCAIGLGNIWKFPYMVGENGGGAFVLIYILFLLIFGIPVLAMEFTVGRGSQVSPLNMYTKLRPDKKGWGIFGKLAIAGSWILMMFYTVVASWMLTYFFKAILGNFNGQSLSGIESIFSSMLDDPLFMFVMTAVVIAMGFIVCSTDLKKGLERVSKFLMIGLLAVIIILVIAAMTMSGAPEGLKFYLQPDVDELMNQGIANVMVAAMSQAFFTLSIGIGAMAIFGSYIGKERRLLGESISVAAIDTFIAIMAGLIIFPACFTYGIDVDAGPNLIFITMPTVFANIPGGNILGPLFFLLMALAAFTTVFAVFEELNSATSEIAKCDRKKASLINFPIMLLLALPCVLGFNILSGFQPFGAGSSVLDLEDFIVSNILLPLGGLITVLFCCHKFGWGWDNFENEVNTGKGLKVARWMKGYLTYVLPVLVGALIIIGLLQKFGVM